MPRTPEKHRTKPRRNQLGCQTARQNCAGTFRSAAFVTVSTLVAGVLIATEFQLAKFASCGTAPFCKAMVSSYRSFSQHHHSFSVPGKKRRDASLLF